MQKTEILTKRMTHGGFVYRGVKALQAKITLIERYQNRDGCCVNPFVNPETRVPLLAPFFRVCPSGCVTCLSEPQLTNSE